MRVGDTQSYEILNTSTNTTGAGFSINRVISAAVTINTDYTTAGAMTFSTQGYNGSSWVVLDSRTITDQDTTVEAWSASFPAYEQIRVVSSGTSGTITSIATLTIKA